MTVSEAEIRAAEARERLNRTAGRIQARLEPHALAARRRSQSLGREIGIGQRQEQSGGRGRRSGGSRVVAQPSADCPPLQAQVIWPTDRHIKVGKSPGG